ncbi:type II toxin-antitoxin system RelE/ParE family toxin [Candidatus Berkelbacteria bacterium]|nr:type II toxin-antitoxin system RelE/ParE family toxin [Candidatus Berkelbacteria bacterium]
MNISWTRPAAKQLRALPRSIQERIAQKMRFFAAQPDPLHFAKPVIDHPRRYRFRIGEYRVIVQRDGQDLYVMRAGKRASVYS